MATKAPQGSGRKSTKGQRNDKLFVLNPETLRDIIRAEKPRVMDVFHHFDTDHDGKVSMTELIVGVQSVFAAAEEDVIRGLFSRADKDGSGEIGFDELDDLFRHWDQNDEDNARRVAVESKTKRDLSLARAAEAERLAAEAEAARRAAEEEAIRLAEEEAARRLAAEEAKRLAAEEAAARKEAEAEAARRAAEEAAARKKAKDEAARKAAEEAAARKKADEERRRRLDEEAKRRQAAEEEARRRADEAARKQKRADEQARLAALRDRLQMLKDKRGQRERDALALKKRNGEMNSRLKRTSFRIYKRLAGESPVLPPPAKHVSDEELQQAAAAAEAATIALLLARENARKMLKDGQLLPPNRSPPRSRDFIEAEHSKGLHVSLHRPRAEQSPVRGVRASPLLASSGRTRDFIELSPAQEMRALRKAAQIDVN